MANLNHVKNESQLPYKTSERFILDNFLLISQQDHHISNPKSSFYSPVNFQASFTPNTHDMETISPSISPRRLAITERHLSLVHGSMSIHSFNFSLLRSKKDQVESRSRKEKPDFSGFSWKQPHMSALVCSEAAPISPRTLPHQRLLPTAVSNDKSTQ